MADPRPLQKSASDPEQVQRAGRVVKGREGAFLLALRDVLDHETGRLVLYELIQRAGVYRSIWRMSAEIHYLAGRQDLGHELMASCYEASEDLYQLMEREARLRQTREDRGTVAAHTPKAGTDG